MDDLKRTVFWDLHRELGAKMVPFAGYDMPVQYPLGVLGEHLHTRSGVGLFDVSHMGQVILRPLSGEVADAALALERLVPVDVLGLDVGRQRYAIFTNDVGGILDDLMVANRGNHLFVVVNSACKDADIAHMQTHLSDLCEVVPVADRALVALQGPEAETVLEAVAPGATAMRFMDVATLQAGRAELWVSRSGYTGEDGFEISVSDQDAMPFVRSLLDQGGVEPVGLGARDSLRLEAGFCLYGSDLDTTTSPAEAGLGWAIQKVRRRGGLRAGGFPGAGRILTELQTAPIRLRVGLLPEGRAPMRAGTAIYATENGRAIVGHVTSGAYGPSIERPLSMGYVETDHAITGNQLWGEVRGKRLPVLVADMPFRPSTYKRQLAGETR